MTPWPQIDNHLARFFEHFTAHRGTNLNGQQKPLSHLKRLDSSGLKRLDPKQLAQPWKPVYSAGVYGQPLDLDASQRTIQPITRTINATAIQSMADAIRPLPEPTESIHLWIGGKHSLGHLIAAVLELAKPATIDDLSIATLTFSKANAEEWADMIDRKKIRKCTIITSCYFEKTSAHIYQYATNILRPRGADIFALQTGLHEVE